MAICISDKSLFRDPESICNAPCGNAVRSFTREVDGAPLVSIPLPFCSTVDHINLMQILLNGKANQAILYEKSTMEGTCLKCDGKSEVSQGIENWERNKGISF